MPRLLLSGLSGLPRLKGLLWPGLSKNEDRPFKHSRRQDFARSVVKLHKIFSNSMILVKETVIGELLANV